MGKKTLGILVGVFVLLLVGVVAVNRSQQPVQSQEISMSKVTPDQVTQINITVNGATTTLKSVDGEWRVVTPFDDRANTDAVGRIITALTYVRLSSPLSENPERHARYDLTPQAAVRLQVFVRGRETPEIDYWVGKSAEDGNSSFIRVGASPEVRTAEGLPPGLLLRNPEEFRSPNVVSIDPEQTTSLSAAGAVAVSLDTSSTTWVDAVTKRIVPGDKRQSVIHALRAWRASSFAVNEPGNIRGFDKPYLSIEMKSAGTPTVIAVGTPVPGKTPAQRYVRVSNRPALLEVDETMTAALIETLKQTQ